MLILRCTQKLRRKNLGPLALQMDSLVPALGGWHANLIYIARRPVVFCVNDQSLLSVLVPGREFPEIICVIRKRIGERLLRMNLPSELIAAERAAIEVVKIQPSNSKSVLGSMNDFVRGLKCQRHHFRLEEVAGLEDMLSHTPMGALNYEYPVKVAYKLLNNAGKVATNGAS